ncbi:MAG TPA: tetratricopeptide repeat protein [Thermoanaerobaculia bacterium]|nr:tetratricopeptide repeat protein [Thermoanaerobaculia bacterium]
MKKYSLLLIAVLSLTTAAVAQEFPNEPHEFLLAKLAAEEGRFDEALNRLDKVIAKTPGDQVLLYERAMILIDANRIDRAETELRKIAQQWPEFYEANRVLGRVLLDRAGADRPKVEEALRYLQAAYKASPDDLSTGIVVSQILRSLNRMAEAERVLAAMVERAPDQRALNFNYAQVLTALERTPEAKQYLERTVAIDPTFGAAVTQLLDIYQAEGQWQKAAAALQPLITENPMRLELQRQQAYFYLRAGDSRGARDRFRSLVAADPKDERSLFYLAEALNDLEEYAEAEQHYRKLIASDATDVDYATSFALSLAGQKKWDEATQAFTKLQGMADVPPNLIAVSRTQLAFIALQKAEYDKAVETAKSTFVFNEKPNTQAVNIALEALKKQKKTAEAVALLVPLVEQFPSDPFVNARYLTALVNDGQKEKAGELAAAQAKIGSRNLIAASEAYIQAGDFPSAVALLQSAVAAKPEDVDLKFQLGSVQERAGDRKASETVFLQVLEKNPEHAPSLNYLGYMWAENGVNLERAQEMLIRAVGQDPDNGAYVDSLGWVYFRLGQLDLAEKYLTDAARLLPRDPTVHEHLGDVLAKRGDMQGALKRYRIAVDLDPESKDVAKLRSKIAEIERGKLTSER